MINKQPWYETIGCMTESSVGISAMRTTSELDYVDMDGALLLRRHTWNNH
jgi:hypothetical protein